MFAHRRRSPARRHQHRQAAGAARGDSSERRRPPAGRPLRWTDYHTDQGGFGAPQMCAGVKPPTAGTGRVVTIYGGQCRDAETVRYIACFGGGGLSAELSQVSAHTVTASFCPHFGKAVDATRGPSWAKSRR